MRAKGRLVGPLLVLMGLLMASFPPAFAGTANVQDAGQSCGGAGCHTGGIYVTSALFGSQPTAGNILVAFGYCQFTGVDYTVPIMTISDTLTNVWHESNVTGYSGRAGYGFIQRNGPANEYVLIDGWWASNKATGADSITVQCTDAPTSMDVEQYEVSGGKTNGIKSEVGGDTTGTSFTTTLGPATHNSLDFLAGLVFDSTAGVRTAGTGFFMNNNGAGTSEYSVSGAANPTRFPMTGANGYWADFGIVVPENDITITKIVPCTFTQIQCWWYPLLFYGVFGGAFMMIGRLGQIEGRSMLFLLLAGLTYCSLIQVQMNMTNIMLPVILSITGIAYAVRGR